MSSILGRTAPLLVALGLAAPALADTNVLRDNVPGQLAATDAPGGAAVSTAAASTAAASTAAASTAAASTAATSTGTPSSVDAPAPAGTQALVEQAQRHEHGEGTTRDVGRAHDLYCAAARAGNADAMVRLGWMYANGRGVMRDDSYANTLFLRASARGSELGTRLAAVIRGDAERLPPCMTPPKAVDTARTVSPVRGDAGITPVVLSPAEFRDAPRSVDWKKLVGTVVQMARDFRLDPRLVFALIRVESNFDPQARSPKNAQGLMQLIPETAERFAVTDVFDPVQNLRGGMSYLRWLLSYFKGDVVLTLAAYNAGEGAVMRHRGVPPYAETVAYVQRIRALYPLDRHPFDPRIAQLNPPTGPRPIAAR